MRVLHAAKKLPPQIGGDATAVAALARAQRRAGLTVDLVAYMPMEGEDEPPTHRVGPPQRGTDLDRISFRRLRGMRALRRWARDRLPSLRPDIVHAHAVDVAYAIAPIVRKYRIPLVLTCHGVWFSTRPRSSPRGLLERLLIRVADPTALTSVDGPSVQALRAAGFREPTLIRNGVDVDEFPSAEGTSRPFRFLFVGRHEFQKGLDVLLLAVAHLGGDANRFVVELAGDGSLTDDLRRQSQSLGIQGVVQFLGRLSREEVLHAFARADAFVLPSRFEGLPISILEAWAAKLPVIATAVGGVPDMCTEETSILVPPENPGALARAMQEIMEDEPRRTRLGESGNRLVRERFAWDAIAGQYLEVYRSLL